MILDVTITSTYYFMHTIYWNTLLLEKEYHLFFFTIIECMIEILLNTH